jgi:hypothetical protein
LYQILEKDVGSGLEEEKSKQWHIWDANGLTDLDRQRIWIDGERFVVLARHIGDPDYVEDDVYQVETTDWPEIG